MSDWLASCERLLPHATDRALAPPGHKLPYRGLPRRLSHLIGNRHGALGRLRAALAEGSRTAAGCFAALLQHEIGEAECGLALAEAVAHLNHLPAAGEVVRDRRQDGAWLWAATA